MSGGIILTTSSEALGDQLVASEGLVSQAFDRVLCGASNNWSTQALRATKVPVVPGMSISTLYWMQITAGSAVTLFRGGWQLDAGESVSFEMNGSDDLYGITGSSSAVVHVLKLEP